MPGKERKRYTLIEEMINRYVQRAWSDAEMAEELDTDRTNIWRIRTNILEYQMGIPIYEESRGQYRINREHFVSYVRLTPPEKLALYLGGRRLQQQTRTGQQDIASALKKLAEALQKPLMQNLVRSAQFILDQEQDERQGQVMRVIVEGWINNRRVRIKHRKLHGQLRSYIVSPYQLEPAVWGDGTYLIGDSDYHNGLATFKITRIESATLTAEPFTIPDDFDSHKLLQHAWGIWHADEDPVTVRLKFSPFVTPRVKESIWHPEQTIQDDDEGGCIWQAEIAEWREMVPWVRGWGSDVEVLKPQPLRQLVKEHIHRQVEIYGIETGSSNEFSRLLKLWGKTSASGDVFHPALFHMFDVGYIAQQLLSSKASSRWRNVLSAAFNCNPEDLYEWLPWFIALHDIGKLTIPFQAQNTIQRSRLERLGFGFGAYSQHHKNLYHPISGYLALRKWAEHFSEKWGKVVLDMVAGHHGSYQNPDRAQIGQWLTLQEPEEWEVLRQQAIMILRSVFLLHQPPSWPEPENISAAIAALNGFAILCDWLGSDENYFPATAHASILDYLPTSRQQARMRVESAGFFSPTKSVVSSRFKDLFGFAPRPLQVAVNEIPNEILTKPTLTIIEAPTGEGKTEAALTLAHRIGLERGSDEMYVALPTTATSNAMYLRIQEHLENHLKLPAPNLRLIHSQDFLMVDDLPITPLSNGDGRSQDHPALDWFAPKKRALLAPFGVGTIDQAELAALNVRHNALRLVGLAGKVVILDEVHAYDTYMTTIIKRMLQWLSALGCSVILLSATLPVFKRQELVQAYTGTTETPEMKTTYPLLICAGENGYHSSNPAPVQPDKAINLNFLHFAEEDWQGKARWLVEKVENGGCICWLSNTVHRAQQIFQALKEISPPDVACDLLHARFPINDRQKIEERILNKYGKTENGLRPQKGIVIGTQVLEQSLDLDFDLLVTDLAPVDLLLQRIGRLHRHPQRSNRSTAFPIPQVYINAPLDDAGQLLMGADQFYTLYLLHRTWEVLKEKEATQGQIILPADYRALVEYVYDNAVPDAQSPWRLMWEDRHKKEIKYEDEARLRIANAPDPEYQFWKGQTNKFEENEESNNWIVAQTRYQEHESITLIPMELLSPFQGRLWGEPNPVNLDEALKRPDQLEFLRKSIRVSNPYLVQAIKIEYGEDNAHPLFKESPLLKHCFPLWLTNGTWHGFVGQREIFARLDPDLGLIYQIKNPHKGGENV